MNIKHNLEKCSECGRPMMIIQGSYGTHHSDIIDVVCGGCFKKLGINESFEYHNPSEALRIQEWLDAMIQTEEKRIAE